MPNYIGHVTRNMIENGGVDPQIVDKCHERDARTDTCANDADLFVALHFQPRYRRASVGHRLPYRLQRSAHIRSNKMIGPFEFRRHTFLVIGKRQP